MSLPPMPEKLKLVVVLLGVEWLFLFGNAAWFSLAVLTVLMAGLVRGDDRARVFLLVIAGLGSAFGVFSLWLSCLTIYARIAPSSLAILLLASSLYLFGCSVALLWVLQKADVRAWMQERTKVFVGSVDAMGPYRSMAPSPLPSEMRQPPSQPLVPRQDVFTPLEAAVFEKLLEGDHEILATLRAQFAIVKLAYRQRTAKGIILNLTVSTEAPVVEGEPDLRIDDVLVRIDGLRDDARFVLTVRRGRMATLEAVTRDERWPDTIDIFAVDYVEPQGAGAVQQRWISQIRPHSS